MSNSYSSYLGARRCCDTRGPGPVGPEGPTGPPRGRGEKGFKGATGAVGATSAVGATGRASLYDISWNNINAMVQDAPNDSSDSEHNGG